MSKFLEILIQWVNRTTGAKIMKMFKFAKKYGENTLDSHFGHGIHTYIGLYSF